VKMSDLLYDEPAGPERPSAAAASERNVQRENWMLAPPIGLTSGRPKESPLPPAKNDPDEIHVSSRELNPQLRQLLRPPSDDSTSTNPVPPDPSKRPRPVGDGGASWRAKALKRAKEQAATEGRALDDVVEERWGSLTDLRGSARDTQRRQGGYRGEREYAQHAGARMRRPEDDRDRRMDSRDERNHQEERNYARTQRPDVSRSSDVREKRDPGGGRSERRDIQPSGSQQRQKSDLDKAIGARIQKEQGGRQEEHSTDRPNDIRHERNESDQQQASQPARKSKVDLDKAIQARIQKEQEKRSQGQGESAANDKKKVVTISEFDEHGRPIATSSNQSEGRIGVQRGKYFEDDNADLSTLVRREKEGALHNYDRAFAGRIAHNGKFEGREGDEYDGGMMEGFGEGVARKNKKQRQGQGMQNVDRDRNRAIAVTSRIQTQMERCTLCFDNPNKARHLIVAIGEKVYLCVPKTGALVKGHCMIVPMAHTKATTDLDEDVWDEIQAFRRALERMYGSQGRRGVYMETVIQLRKNKHTFVEAVPLPNDLADDAPMYFKKAIMEADEEWAQNKKLLDTRTRDLRSTIPKGFPYFHVGFGEGGGFAHIVEDENKFPWYFGREVLAGMLDLNPNIFLHPKRLSPEEERKQAQDLMKSFEPYDWTQQLEGGQYF